MIFECSVANIDFLLRSWNNKQYNEIKQLFSILMAHLLNLLRSWANLSKGKIQAKFFYCIGWWLDCKVIRDIKGFKKWLWCRKILLIKTIFLQQKIIHLKFFFLLYFFSKVYQAKLLWITDHTLDPFDNITFCVFYKL